MKDKNHFKNWSEAISQIKINSDSPLIRKRKEELNKLDALWNYITELNESVGLNTKTMSELQAKISSRIAFCERSIRDNSKQQS